MTARPDATLREEIATVVRARVEARAVGRVLVLDLRGPTGEFSASLTLPGPYFDRAALAAFRRAAIDPAAVASSGALDRLVGRRMVVTRDGAGRVVDVRDAR